MLKTVQYFNCNLLIELFRKTHTLKCIYLDCGWVPGECFSFKSSSMWAIKACLIAADPGESSTSSFPIGWTVPLWSEEGRASYQRSQAGHSILLRRPSSEALSCLSRMALCSVAIIRLSITVWAHEHFSLRSCSMALTIDDHSAELDALYNLLFLFTCVFAMWHCLDHSVAGGMFSVSFSRADGTWWLTLGVDTWLINSKHTPAYWNVLEFIQQC